MSNKIIGFIIGMLFLTNVLPISNSVGIIINESYLKPEQSCMSEIFLHEDSLESDDIVYSKTLDNLPDKWDWRDVNGEDWTTPIKDQLQDICGSCWAFGALGGLEAAIKIWEDNPSLEVDLSEQYMLSCSPGSCNGWYWTNTLNWIKKNGAIPESCLPYEADDTIPCEAKCSEWRHLLIGIEDRHHISSAPSAIQSAIVEYGPLPASMTVYEDFYPNFAGGVYRHTWGDVVFGHCITIVGFDNTWGRPDEGYWICKNSWGTEWGEDGWFRIAYGECEIEESVYYYTGPNHLPAKPSKPEGTTEGQRWKAYTYKFTASDPDDDTIKYYIDWGDGNTSHTEDYVKSGETISMEYTWMDSGTYEVKYMVKDEHGLESEESDPLSVHMPKNKAIEPALMKILESHSLHFLNRL
jgi:C1A family cysteine protease